MYCRVMADVLRAEGHQVVLAGAVRELEDSRRAAFVAALRRRGDVTFIDTSRMPRGGKDADLGQVTRLVREVGPEVTVFTEADDHLRLLAHQVAPGRRLPGRRVGVFLRSTRYVHVGRRRETLYERARRVRHGRMAWDRDPYVFHERLLPRFGLLDAALSLDEVFVAGHGASHQWLPDIYASYDAEDWALDATERSWLQRLDGFLEDQGGRAVLVYYGTAQARRGYPGLLRLAEAVDACVVHCGVRPPVPGEQAEVERLRDALARRGALFETDSYLAGYEAARRFLAAADCVVLPYRRHYVSSGVMLQALHAGRPVLVPDRGLMAWRTTGFGLGRTYPEASFEGLVREFGALHGDGYRAYAPRIEAFLQHFTKERTEAALRCAFGFGGAPADPPAPPRPTTGGAS